MTELKEKVTKLSNDLKDKETEYKKGLADRDFSDLLKSVVSNSGARDSKAVIAFLDQEALKASKNQKEDVQAAVDAVKKDKDYLFQPEKAVPRVVSVTPGANPAAESKNAQANEALRSLFGKE